MHNLSDSQGDPRIKLRHVRCFLAVARARSVARAADALGLSQPAVSKTLAELEALLGVRLMTRGRSGAALTPAGARLLPGFAGSLSEIDRGLAALRGAGPAERLRIGALPTVAAAVAPQAVAALLAARDDVTVALTSGPNAFLLDQLIARRLDVVIGRLGPPEAMAGLSFEHLYSEPVRFVVRPGHPLLGDGPPDPRRLADFLVLIPDPAAVIRPAVDRLLIALGAGTLKARIETVSTAFGRATVRRSDAIWIISDGVVANDLADGALAALDIDTRDTQGPVGLTTRADDPPSPARLALARAIRAAAAGRAQGGSP